MGRDCLRLKSKEKAKPRDGEGQTLRTLLELLDPAMSEASITGMVCHLRELTLVVFLSPKTRKVLIKKESLKLNPPRRIIRLSLNGYGYPKELGLNPCSAASYLSKT